MLLPFCVKAYLAPAYIHTGFSNARRSYCEKPSAAPSNTPSGSMPAAASTRSVPAFSALTPPARHCAIGRYVKPSSFAITASGLSGSALTYTRCFAPCPYRRSISHRSARDAVHISSSAPSLLKSNRQNSCPSKSLQSAIQSELASESPVNTIRIRLSSRFRYLPPSISTPAFAARYPSPLPATTSVSHCPEIVSHAFRMA